MKETRPNSLRTLHTVDWTINKALKSIQRLRLMTVSWQTMMSCPEPLLVRIRISFLPLNISHLIEHRRPVSIGLYHDVLDLVKANEAKHNRWAFSLPSVIPYTSSLIRRTHCKSFRLNATLRGQYTCHTDFHRFHLLTSVSNDSLHRFVPHHVRSSVVIFSCHFPSNLHRFIGVCDR